MAGAPAPSRGPAPAPWATSPLVHGVRSAAPSAARGGRRWPGSRGRPGGLGFRGGGGAERAAASRRRVLPRARGNGAPLSSRSSAAQRLAATTTSARSGHQRTPSRRLGHARAVTGCWRRPRGASQRSEGPQAGTQGRALPRAAQARGPRPIHASQRRPRALPPGVCEDRPGARERPWAGLGSPRRRALGASRPTLTTPRGMPTATRSRSRRRLAVRGAQTARVRTRGAVCKSGAALPPIIRSIAVTVRCPGARTTPVMRTCPGCHTGRATTAAKPPIALGKAIGRESLTLLSGGRDYGFPCRSMVT